MYQMMQLPGEALVQYEEIEALLAFAPKSIKDIGGWPIFDSTDPFGKMVVVVVVVVAKE